MAENEKQSLRTNAEVARVFDRVAALLEQQNANPFRVASYRNAAALSRGLDRPLAEIFATSGLDGLERLPGIGRSLARAIARILESGRLPLLERLQGHEPPERLFATIPGIGNALAQRVYTMLKLETLEDLEAAAHDGRLERVPGFGPRRARAVSEVLAGRLGMAARQRVASRFPPDTSSAPPVAMLLEVDREYRERGRRGELRRIAPRRFNPAGRAWLPILHTERDDWTFTALFSNSARAHDLGMTQDWVVIFYERDGIDDHCTVVTEPRGLLAGRRVVRGREDECRALYDQAGDATVASSTYPPAGMSAAP